MRINDFLDTRRLKDLLFQRRIPIHALAMAGARTSGLFGTTVALAGDLLLREALSGRSPEQLRPEQVQRWCQALCKLFGVQIELHGALPPSNGKGVLFIANHRTYADIAVIGSLTPTVFVSRVELKKWPLLGWGAQLGHIIFVDRDNPESRLGVRREVRARLEAGASVALFPEGTAHNGQEMLPFKPGSFKTVAGMDITLVPISLWYPPELKIEWQGGGDLTFLDHLILQASQRILPVYVEIGRPFECRDYGQPGDAMRLLEEVRAEIEAGVGRMRTVQERRSGDVSEI